ncbi:hypothetical protein BD311DRAFT_764981 [Dichomitus squalens]|uniref:Uncharacterized protein n=1 Tax=Dichomitus squalens TaxID=114155 RepID=A0A4Q9MD88_9APHY|nr:hypothetical protein BD311DRAFT_764981 [Dichomitus squalens]
MPGRLSSWMRRSLVRKWSSCPMSVTVALPFNFSIYAFDVEEGAGPAIDELGRIIVGPYHVPRSPRLPRCHESSDGRKLGACVMGRACVFICTAGYGKGSGLAPFDRLYHRTRNPI